MVEDTIINCQQIIRFVSKRQKVNRKSVDSTCSFLGTTHCDYKFIRPNWYLILKILSFSYKLEIKDSRYICIEYLDKDIIVLESLIPGNAYFAFYNTTIYALRKAIKNKSKSKIFEISGMSKRGYHIRDTLNLELRIKSFFLS